MASVPAQWYTDRLERFSRFLKQQRPPPAGLVKKRQSQSKRAGLAFPATRFRRAFKARMTSKQRMSASAPVYMAGVMEYLCGMYISPRPRDNWAHSDF